MSLTTVSIPVDATLFRAADVVRSVASVILLGVALSGWGVVLWHNSSLTVMSAEVEEASLEQQESVTHERREDVAPASQEQVVQRAVWHAASLTSHHVQPATGEQPVLALPADRVTQFIE